MNKCVKAFNLNRILKINKNTFSQADPVLFDVKNTCGIITLNRPKALNSLNAFMTNMIKPVLDDWKTSKVTHVVIEGAGDKAFCAGGDIRLVTQAGKEDVGKGAKFFRDEYIVNYAIGTFPKPYIALLNGITMGGGVGLSVHGKYRVCTEKTLFAMPETAIGLFPDVGGGYFLPRLPNNMGVYLALTGQRLKAKDVVRAGIGTHFVPSEKIPQLRELLTGVSSNQEVESAICHWSERVDQLDSEFCLAPYLKLIKRHFGFSSIEEILDSLSHETAGSTEREWAQKQIQILEKMSPTSLKISLRQMVEGKHKSLAENLQMEYRMAYGCMEYPDFYEGVRALLIDRDNEPKWRPAHLRDVTNELVAKYFRPLPDDLVLE